MQHIRRQDFDSDAFGIPFYRVSDWNAAAVARELAGLQKRRPIAIDGKAAAEDGERNAFYQRHGFRNVCTQLELHHRLEASGKPRHVIEITDGLRLPQDLLARHARNFTADRFATDVLLPPAGHERLYERWIANSLSGKMHVAWHQTDFCSFSEDKETLSIDLLSVLNPRQGVGRSLVLALVERARRKKMLSVRVVTEAANRPAWLLYFGCGFRLEKLVNCYHFVAV